MFNLNCLCWNVNIFLSVFTTIVTKQFYLLILLYKKNLVDWEPVFLIPKRLGNRSANPGWRPARLGFEMTEGTVVVEPYHKQSPTKAGCVMPPASPRGSVPFCILGYFSKFSVAVSTPEIWTKSSLNNLCKSDLDLQLCLYQVDKSCLSFKTSQMILFFLPKNNSSFSSLGSQWVYYVIASLKHT